MLGSGTDVELRISGSLWESVRAHLDGDGDEHGGVLYCGINRSGRLIRLLGRSFRPAIEGVDYVPSEVGYRALSAGFTLDAALESQQNQLIPLFVHNHPGRGRVAFSAIDLASHARGYPALIKIAQGPVGAIVIADGAVAGDVWNIDGSRSFVRRTVIVTAPIAELIPEPLISPSPSLAHDRHARLFGDAGIEVLGRSKIGVIGAGGVGMPTIQWLSMLGVGEIVAIDPGRVKRTNRSRLPGATKFDSREFPFVGFIGRYLSMVFGKRGTKKIDLARRLAKRTGMGTRFKGIYELVSSPGAVAELKDCDFIVLAADSDVARLAANRISHQYLIPLVQVGSKVVVSDDGVVEDILSVVRPVLPDRGCLACAEIISAVGVSMEVHLGAEVGINDYGSKQPAPSVAALNAIAASNATMYLQLMLTGLHRGGDVSHYTQYPMRNDFTIDKSARSKTCKTCGTDGVVGFGDTRSLRIPTPLR